MAYPQDSFFSSKVQEIHTDLHGEVIQSSDTLFSIEKGENIFDLHPFFESMRADFTSGQDSNLAFPCVQLDMQDKEVICDITIKKERGFLAILLFDYSEHYEHLHDAAQEKKTAMLNEQAHELNVKHYEEKMMYVDFVRKRLDDKLIGQLEGVIADVQKLKATNVSKSQSKLISKIEVNMNELFQKATQIKDNLEMDLD